MWQVWRRQLSGATSTNAAVGNPSRPTAGKIKVVSSANGLEATRKAYEMILAGSDPADAVVAGVGIVEDDPNDTSVGYGGLPNERGIVELDAAVMHGPTHRAGAVASLQNIRHPALVALKVMRARIMCCSSVPGRLTLQRHTDFPKKIC